MAKEFSQVIAIKPLSPYVYVSEPLEAEWSVGSVPNGGYTSCLFASAAVTHGRTVSEANPQSPLQAQPDVLQTSLHFVRRTHIEHPARFTVKDVKIGSRISVIHVTLTQPSTSEGDRSIVEGYITLGNLQTEEGISLPVSDSYLNPRPLPADLEELERRGEDVRWHRFPRKFPEFRRSGQHQETYTPKPESIRGKQEWRGVVDEWIRFTPYSDIDKTSPPSKWTNATLPYVVDNFPLIVEQILAFDGEAARMSWYPTLSLAIDVKKLLPPQGVDWLFLRGRAKVIKNGRMDLDVVIMNGQGEIVAVATHSALALDSSRNVHRNGAGQGQKENADVKGKL